MNLPDIPIEAVQEAFGLDPETHGENFEQITLDQWLGSITDREGTILCVSPEFARKLGYEPDELIGSNHRRISSKLHSPTFFQHLWSTILEGREWSGLIVNRSRRGKLHHFESTIRPVFSADREVIGFVAMRIELNLGRSVIEQNPELPGYVLEQIPEGVVIIDALDPALPVVFVNAAWCRITGYHPDEVMGKGFEQLHELGIQSQQLESLFYDLSVGKQGDCEILQYRRNGTPFWSHISFSPVFASDGRILHYSGIVLDVSDRRAARMMLDLENNLLEEIVRGRPMSQILNLLLDKLRAFIPLAGSAILMVENKSSNFILSAEQGLGEALRVQLTTISAKDEQGFFRDFKVADGIRILNLDTLLFDSHKEDFTTSQFAREMQVAGLKTCWAVDLDSAGGELEAILILTFEQERYPSSKEREFLRLISHLLSLALVRGHSRKMRETIDRKIRQSQRMEAIGTLAGGIAHDFNNILGGLFGFLHLAQEDVGTDHPAQEWLLEIEGACKRARDLVQQVLTFSRTEGNARAPVQLESVIKDASHLARASLPASVEIDFIRPGKVLPEVLGDPTQIQLAILNLCTNAWQAMDHGRGRIELSLTLCPNEGEVDMLEVAVRDNGSGIDPQLAERIFDPFFSTRPVGSGTGLGLSVVHGIMKSHGGQVHFESTPKIGSVFVLQFPVVKSAESEKPVPKDAPPRGNGERILFIDDEMAIVTWARLILQRIGYSVEAFTDPEIALAHLRQNLKQFDLVITDLTMPGISGSEVVHSVREWRPDLPVILTSGRGMVLTAEELADLGSVELLYKPIGMEDLSRSLRKMLDGGSLSQD